MAKAIFVGGRKGRKYDLGPARLVDALFGTISYRLEPNGAGSRFPAVTSLVSSGTLDSKLLADALREVQEIDADLQRIGPDRAITSPTDLSRFQDNNLPVNRGAETARDYFATAAGRPLTLVLHDALLAGRERNEPVSLAETEPAAGPTSGELALYIEGFIVFILYMIDRIITYGERKDALPGPKDGPFWPVHWIVYIAVLLSFVARRYPAFGKWILRRGWFVAGFAALSALCLWVMARG